MSKYKLEFKLKQHTPIIHFQHEQHGATLRATELKPKLDKFIIEKMGGKEYVPEDWFNNKDNPSLDYKVRLNSGEIDFEEIEPGKRNQVGSFFGNMGDEYKKNPKGLVFKEGDIELFITSFNTGLLMSIEINIIPFFETTNFGTRQSKGFGSFTIYQQMKDGEVKNIPYSNTGYKTYFELNVPQNNNWVEKNQEVSKKIELLYNSIRSGINKKGDGGRKDLFYFKSLMFLYAKNVYGAQWEKKTIKENFFNKELGQQKEIRPHSEPLNYSSENKLLIKDLLGLSSEESWHSYEATIKKVQAEKTRGNEWIEKEEKNFERFKSPILFKPVFIKDILRIYIYLDQKSLDEALEANKDFIIKSNRQQTPFYISFPKTFSLNDFFDFILTPNNFDIKTHVEQGFQGMPEYRDLNNFFTQLRKNQN